MEEAEVDPGVQVRMVKIPGWRAPHSMTHYALSEVVEQVEIQEGVMADPGQGRGVTGVEEAEVYNPISLATVANMGMDIKEGIIIGQGQKAPVGVEPEAKELALGLEKVRLIGQNMVASVWMYQTFSVKIMEKKDGLQAEERVEENEEIPLRIWEAKEEVATEVIDRRGDLEMDIMHCLTLVVEGVEQTTDGEETVDPGSC